MRSCQLLRLLFFISCDCTNNTILTLANEGDTKNHRVSRVVVGLLEKCLHFQSRMQIEAREKRMVYCRRNTFIIVASYNLHMQMEAWLSYVIQYRFLIMRNFFSVDCRRVAECSMIKSLCCPSQQRETCFYAIYAFLNAVSPLCHHFTYLHFIQKLCTRDRCLILDRRDSLVKDGGSGPNDILGHICNFERRKSPNSNNHRWWIAHVSSP